MVRSLTEDKEIDLIFLARVGQGQQARSPFSRFRNGFDSGKCRDCRRSPDLMPDNSMISLSRMIVILNWPRNRIVLGEQDARRSTLRAGLRSTPQGAPSADPSKLRDSTYGDAPKASSEMFEPGCTTYQLSHREGDGSCFHKRSTYRSRAPRSARSPSPPPNSEQSLDMLVSSSANTPMAEIRKSMARTKPQNTSTR